MMYSFYIHEFKWIRITHSWNSGMSTVELENSRSRSGVGSNVKVIKLVQHPTDSYPFCSIAIRPPIPENGYFKTCPWKSKVKVMGGVKGQDHIVDPTFSQIMSLCFMSIRPSISEIWLDIQSRPGHDALSHEKKYLVKFKFCILKDKLKHVTHFMQLVDKVWKYEMDWLVSWKIQANMVLSTDDWTDRGMGGKTNRKGETTIPPLPFKFVEAGGYNDCEIYW